MIPSGTRFIGISETVNLTERRSAIINAETQPYTVNDIRGYKVFTALLTQSGGDGPESNNSGNQVPLTIGRTYYISLNNNLEGDFTNVGAPNNEVGTFFVSTGTTPANWGSNSDLLSNTGAPVVTVLENTIGNIFWTYEDVGVYAASSIEGNFTLDKTFSLMTLATGNETGVILNSSRIDDNIFAINVNSVNIPSVSTELNGIVQIEIRVYN